MNFAYPAETEQLCARLAAFMAEHVAPRDAEWQAEAKAGRVPLAVMEPIKQRARAEGQARLGPGRIHHCMRTIGQCELALELMVESAKSRVAFGAPLASFANIQDWIAESRIEIDQARLLTLRAAWTMDLYGNKAARVDVSAIKLVAARLQTRVLDRAIQVFGAAGLTEDTPLAWLWTWGRALRFIDGPDEVHLRTVAKAELRKTDTLPARH